MPPDRSIIHLNVADFAVTVERVLDARLRERPVIVAPAGAARAAVYDMSEEAYRGYLKNRQGHGDTSGLAVLRELRATPGRGSF